MKDTDLAWAAGIVDGEGCIAIQRQPRAAYLRGYYHRLVVSVSNTDPRLLRRLQELFGGPLKPYRQATTGNRRAAWQWTVSSRLARQVLEAILPYLISKKEQAEVALQFVPNRYKNYGGLPDTEYAHRENLRLKLVQFHHEQVA